MPLSLQPIPLLILLFEPDTLYVDMARYSEQPISNVKALFKYWFEKALWHRPTVLIMDNMEKLVGAEVEVTFSFPFFLVSMLMVVCSMQILSAQDILQSCSWRCILLLPNPMRPIPEG